MAGMAKQRCRWIVSIVLVSLVAGIGGGSERVSAATASYEVEDIGKPKSATGGIAGAALNDDGVIAGVAITAKGDRPYIYKRGKFTYLDTPAELVIVYDINAEERIVGAKRDASLSPIGGFWPMLWSREEATALPTLGGEAGRAIAIDDTGAIVGTAKTEPGDDSPSHATIWEDGEPRDIGDPDTRVSWATDINADGQIVGHTVAVDAGQNDLALRWNDGEPEDIGTLGGWTRAHAVNSAGQIVGESQTDAESAEAPVHAFLWQDGEMTDLGALKQAPHSVARDLNDAGLIVGASINYGDYTETAAVIWIDGEIVDLNTLIPDDAGVDLFDAVKINERGQILANGRADGDDPVNTHVVLLTPVDDGAESGQEASGQRDMTAARRDPTLRLA